MVTAEEDGRYASGEEWRGGSGDGLMRLRQVARHGRQITIINAGKRREYGDLLRGVVGAEDDGGGADAFRAKARADAVGATRIEGDADDGEIDAAQISGMRQAHERAQAGIARRFHRIRRAVGRLVHDDLASLLARLG